MPFSRTKNVNDLEEPETKRQKCAQVYKSLAFIINSLAFKISDVLKIAEYFKLW